MQRQADTERRAQERCGDTTAQDGTDSAASQQCISDITQLAVPDADAAQPTTMPGTGSMQCPGTATEHAMQPQLWRPLLHHERYSAQGNHDRITRGYVIEVEVILPDHMHNGCYVSQHAITEKWFREESTDDGEYPVHYLVSDQWHREIARNGFAASALNGKVLTKVRPVICYGYVRHR